MREAVTGSVNAMRNAHVLIIFCAIGCGASVEAGDASVDASTHETAVDDGTVIEAGHCAPESCCCAGDVVDFPICSGDTISCRSGYSLYSGDDCRCLADRDTPCCLPHMFDTGVAPPPDTGVTPPPDTGVTPPPDTGVTPPPDAACGSDLCCCAGDVVDFVVCSDGAASCKAGYGLHSGDDCRCLPDRDTPCCLPHVVDAGH